MVDGLSVCGECGHVFGEVETRAGARRIQRCGCVQRSSPAEPLWDEHDFNMAVELCACCAATPIPTGSRWSYLMCTPCHEHVLDGARPGDALIPVSRHSLANDIAYIIDGHLTAHEFARALIDLGRRLDVLVRWRARSVRTSFPPGVSSMPMSEYLSRARPRAGALEAYTELRAYASSRGHPRVVTVGEKEGSEGNG